MTGGDELSISNNFKILFELIIINLANDTSSNASSNISSVVIARQNRPFSYETETDAVPSMAQAEWNNRFEFVNFYDSNSYTTLIF